jgi:cell division protein FtsQ
MMCAGILMVLGWQVVQAPWFFRVNRVVVNGAFSLSADEVQRLAGIVSGEALLQLDTKKAERRLAADDRIAAAVIHRRLPGTVVIDVDEMRSIAVIPYFSSFVEVDAQGRVLAVTPDAGGGTLPIITGLVLPQVVVGQQVPNLPGWAAACEVLGKLTDDIRSRVAEVNVGDPLEIVVYTEDPSVKVLLGEAKNGAHLSLLPPVLDKLQPALAARPNGFIDLTCNYPVYRER